MFSYKYAHNPSDPVTDILGNQYSSYILLPTSTGISPDKPYCYIDFPLNGEYTRLQGKVGLTERSKNADAKILFKILVDDKEIYSKTVKPGDFPEEIDLNLNRGLKLTISALLDQNSPGNRIEVGIFDAKFYK